MSTVSFSLIEIRFDHFSLQSGIFEISRNFLLKHRASVTARRQPLAKISQRAFYIYARMNSLVLPLQVSSLRAIADTRDPPRLSITRNETVRLTRRILLVEQEFSSARFVRTFLRIRRISRFSVERASETMSCNVRKSHIFRCLNFACLIISRSK